jgi:catechol 2,3-dioxygenase-like lactoylglutathione lyase family enzyme
VPATAQQTAPLISGGSPTVFVTNLDRAVRFFNETLGLKIAYRADDHFCMIDAGEGCLIGLHPPGPNTPKPGSNGGTQIGLTVGQPIESVVKTLTSRGVKFTGPVIDDKAVKLAFFTDPDGNVLYLCEVKT